MKNKKNQSPTLSEGESNNSKKRAEWEAKTHNVETRAILDEDSRYFLSQAVSSPCLSVVVKAEGAYIEDTNGRDRKSTRLNSSHKPISYAVFCLKKKNQKK